MKYFLVENIPGKTRIIIEERAEIFYDIRGSRKEGLKDTAIFELAQKEGAYY